ncbi:hypothetical protein DFH07DRAFT_384307 [Mycena maculata]|uniref:Uncharacterized protein n=1 Tax=Mycena maculata TaxID=230809 RepID=A0AAD7JI84_9AGAR|nr:hypothetical protein DFH07DRAFT_384307 [Mycena maculata]
MRLPSPSSLFKFWRYILFSQRRPMAELPDTSLFALFPPSDQRWVTVPAWVERLYVLPHSETYRVVSLQLYKDPNGIQHEWLRFTVVDTSINDRRKIATIKTDRCSSLDGGSSVDVTSSPSQPGKAYDRIIHALDSDGADLLGKGPRLVMQAMYDPATSAPSILDIAAALMAIHNFSPNYDAMTAACFNYSITGFLLITDRFNPARPVEIFARHGYAADMFRIRSWAKVLEALGITNHIPLEKSLSELLDAYTPALASIMAGIHQHKLALQERDAASAALGERDTALGERDAALGERDAALGERDAARGERDAALGERDTVLGERDTVLGERDTALEERDAALKELALVKERVIGSL